MPNPGFGSAWDVEIRNSTFVFCTRKSYYTSRPPPDRAESSSNAAAQTVQLTEAHATIQKADKDSITFQPRDAAGKFGKGITIKLTGTTRITMLTPQVRDKKQIMAQRDADAKDLVPGQMVSVICASPKGQDPVLLAAIVHPK